MESKGDESSSLPVELLDLLASGLEYVEELKDEQHLVDGQPLQGHVSTERFSIFRTQLAPAVDIPHLFSKIYADTINSGDINRVHDFFAAHMSPACRFVIQHDISKAFGIPDLICSRGMASFALHLAALFDTFPDFVFTLVRAKVVSSREWRGYVVSMETELRGNMLYTGPIPAGDRYLARYSRSVSGGFELHSAQQGYGSSMNRMTASTAGSVWRPPKALPLHTRGTVTLYVDPHHRIQYLQCRQKSML